MPEVVATIRGFPSPAGQLDFDVHVGDIIWLRGGNGSGKTSLLRSLAGLPAARVPQHARLGSGAPTHLPARELSRRVHLCFQDPVETLVGLTVAGEFRLRSRPVPKTLQWLADRDVATLSSGESRRVGLALVAPSTVPLLLLDEPAEGLDTPARALLLDAVREQARHGAVIAADHSGILAALATRVIHLASSAPKPSATIPRPTSGVVLETSAFRARRGLQEIDLPSLQLGAGFHVVQGPNACGKSTLLLQLAGLLETVPRIAGAPARPGDTVQLLLPRAADLFTHELVAQELAKVAPDWTARFVPSELLARHPLSLSAGEAQRVALAKCLGRSAPVYLLDEPEAHLDAAGRAALVESIALRVSDGACILAATHDPELAALAHRRITMEAT